MRLTTPVCAPLRLPTIRGKIVFHNWFLVPKRLGTAAIISGENRTYTGWMWVRKIPWRRARQPTPVFFPGKSHGHEAWWATVHRAAKSWHNWSDLPCSVSQCREYIGNVTKSDQFPIFLAKYIKSPAEVTEVVSGNGAQIQALVPWFPSLCFHNHYGMWFIEIHMDTCILMLILWNIKTQVY